MEEKQEHQCARIGMIMSLGCVTLGAIGPFLAMAKEFAASLPGARFERGGIKWSLLIGLIVTMAALYLVAIFLGRKAGEKICWRRSRYGGAIFTGIGLALSCLAIGSVVTALCIAVDAAWRLGPDHAYRALSLLLLIWLYGILPAILLGVLYGVLVRWQLNKVKY